MAYKSLYRKYRPSNFDEVCGQNHIIKTLKSAINSNKISHAYLFTGSRGTGKTTVAKIFAKMVNCVNMTDNGPCLKCEMCTCENTDLIPDIIEIDAASNNGVDEIREIKNKIKIMPVKCRYKVYIIDEVHMLSTGAFNALLKTLEEPPEHIIFILATTEPHKLPITIISRCQRFDFEKISLNNIIDRLKFISKKEKITISEDAIYEIAKLSDGAMRDAIGLLEQLSSFSDNITLDDVYTLKGSVSIEKIIELMSSFTNGNQDKMLDLIEEIYNSGKDFNLLISDMISIFRDVLVCKKAKKYFEQNVYSKQDEIKKLAEAIDEDKITNIIYELEMVSKKTSDSSYSRILLEICLLSNINSDNKFEQADIKVLDNKEEEKSNPIIELKEENNKEQTDDYKNIVINNTIVNATNDQKSKIRNVLLNLDKYLVDKKSKKCASLLKDATVVAASHDHVLFTFKYSSFIEDFNGEIDSIIKLFEKIFNVKYKMVALIDSEWKEKRPYYVEQKKLNKLKYIEEKENIKLIIKKEKNSYIDLFGEELVEMKG